MTTAGHAATVLDGIRSEGGLHCETTALGVLLAHAGLELSEPVLFGLGSGLSFIYWDSSRQDAPFVGGRVKPFALTENLVSLLDIDLRVQETTSPRKAWQQVREVIDAGIPVGLQLDSHDLEYFGSRVHFAGHVVALYGYDDERAYLVDTAQQGGRVSTSLQSLATARAARGPMSARHRSFFLPGALAPLDDDRLNRAVVGAIVACAEDFLAPPIANIGCRGIRTASRRFGTLFDRVAEPSRDLPLLGTLMERAGTGGSLFRAMYRDFLVECRDRLAHTSAADPLDRAATGFADAARMWTTVSVVLTQAGETQDAALLTDAAAVLVDIADVETAAMQTLRSLGSTTSLTTR